MSTAKKSQVSLTESDPERSLEFEFVRACENAALNSMHWLGRGDKESADAAACDAIRGTFDRVDIRGEVVIGEGQHSMRCTLTPRPSTRAPMASLRERGSTCR